MTRLPTVGADSGAWGTVLNQYLQVGHNATGTNSGSMPIFNVKDDAYGCKVDGVTDDTTGLASALAAANAAGGGVVSGFNGGTCISGNQTLYSNVIVELQGGTIKLKNGANTDLFSAQTSSINLSAAGNAGIVGTLSKFKIRNGILDGNKANQSGGTSYPIRFYGYDFVVEDVEILNGYSGGWLSDWNGGFTLTSPSDNMEARLTRVKIHDCNGIGLQWGGPHDSHLDSVFSYNNGSHNFHFAPNSNGVLCVNCHGYQLPNVTGLCCFLVESGTGACFANCIAEGATQYGVVLLGPLASWVGGGISNGAVGLQLGQQAGQTPFPGQIKQSAGLTTAVSTTGGNIETIIANCTTSSINFANESNNAIKANVYQTAGSYINGTPATSDTYLINGTGLTADGTLAKSGGFQVVSSANPAFSVRDNTGAFLFHVDGFSNGTSGINVPGPFHFTAAGGMGLNATPSSSIALQIDPGGDTVTGLVIFPNSGTQSSPLFATQNASFANVFTIDKSGQVIMPRFAINSSIQTAVAALIGADADNHNCIVLFPNSGTQSVPLFKTQNSSFADVFTIDLNGNIAAATVATAQSATAPDPGASGTIATANIGVSRVNPSGGSRSGCILASGTVAGQEVWVINEHASNTITFAASGTSHVADGVSDVIAANSARHFKWDSSTSLWYKAA